MTTKFWDDTREGDELTPCAFPLSVYRLVVAAGANRDFNPIHHDSAYAQSAGAPDMYANNLLLQGMWEKTARAYLGDGGRFLKLSGFRMRSFNAAGDLVTTGGRVVRRWRDGGVGCLDLQMWCRNGSVISVGPGNIIASMPLR